MPAHTACIWLMWTVTSSRPGWTGPTRQGRPRSPRQWTTFWPGTSHRRRLGIDLSTAGTCSAEPRFANDELREAVNRVADLAPLHVPVALRLLDRMRERLPSVPHVLCPDTAFHAGLPDAAATYALPASWRSRWGLRRYGFHGLSYAWATRRAARLLDRDVAELQMVLTHLGGGSSVCAVNAGRSVDTSMGFTPLDGVPMSTRSGAVDPGMLIWLLESRRLSLDELADGLNHQSGLLGLSAGRSNDTRDLVAAAAGDPAAALALDVFVHRVRREIAAAATSLDRLDAVVFHRRDRLGSTGGASWHLLRAAPARRSYPHARQPERRRAGEPERRDRERFGCGTEGGTRDRYRDSGRADTQVGLMPVG